MQVEILNPKRTLFSGDAGSMIFQGDTGEFEVLDFHKPVISLLKKGKIVIDRTKILRVNSGIMKMNDNRVLVLVEE